MRRPLPDDEFEERLSTIRRSAWRWEQQPAYFIGDEQPLLDAFLAGHPEPPQRAASMREWAAMIRRNTDAGLRYARVRVVEEPPTDYQRWMMWITPWCAAAGEQIDYLSRPQLAGLPPAPFGSADWWLLDDAAVATQPFDATGRRLPGELVDDPEAVAAARLWRHLVTSLTQQHRQPAAA